MRTVSEKLDLLSAKRGRPHRSLLHNLYLALEDEYGVSLDEERLRVMEEQNLTDCSVLAAIFYTPELKTRAERIIDFNLSPENRGW